MFVAGRQALTPIGGRNWMLDGVPLVYRGKTDTFTVPVGFVTDLASTPRLTWWLVPSADQSYLLAAILHDYLVRVEIAAGRVTSHDADGIFRRVLQEEGVRPVKANIMWTAVRWGSLTQKSRRRMPEFIEDFPAVLGWSFVGLPVIALGVIGAAFGLILLEVFERAVQAGRSWK